MPAATPDSFFATETRLGLPLPAAYRTWLETQGGQGCEDLPGQSFETQGFWLPIEAIGPALDFELADFTALRDLDDADLERLIVVRLNEDDTVFGVLDYRDDPHTPAFFLVEAEADDLDQDALRFDSFEAFQAALQADPDWATGFQTHDPDLAERWQERLSVGDEKSEKPTGTVQNPNKT